MAMKSTLQIAAIGVEFGQIRGELGSIRRESETFSRVASGPAASPGRLDGSASRGTPAGLVPWSCVGGPAQPMRALAAAVVPGPIIGYTL